MKKKKILSVVITAALFFTGCSDNGGQNNSEISDTSREPSADITTNRISAVENQPEDTALRSTSPEDTSVPEGGLPLDKPEGFPPPYPSAKVDDPSALSEFKKIIKSAETAQSILYGKSTLIPLSGDEINGYRMISSDYARNIDGLTEKMYDGIKYTFWEDHYGREIEDMLSGLVKETEDGIMLKYEDVSNVAVIETDSVVIAKLDDPQAELVALGKRGEDYIWRRYSMVNGVRGWVIRDYTDEKVTGEIAVFTGLLIDNRDTLDKIFGNAAPVKDSAGDWNSQLVTIENDMYGHGFYNGLEVEAFMTVEEMRGFIRDNFTSEIADSYISLYINRTYVEKDGKLFIISGSVLPGMGAFSLDNYENRSLSVYDVTSMVDWSDGNVSYRLPITVAYEGGRWKVDTRLPMGADRVIGG